MLRLCCADLPDPVKATRSPRLHASFGLTSLGSVPDHMRPRTDAFSSRQVSDADGSAVSRTQASREEPHVAFREVASDVLDEARAMGVHRPVRRQFVWTMHIARSACNARVSSKGPSTFLFSQRLDGSGVRGAR